jgi:hypothetical protein
MPVDRLFFGPHANIADRLRRERFRLDCIILRPRPEQADPMATVHVAAVQILVENLYGS